jgi:NADPH-dependent 2,4-dienoyl-CoA reductase/sulfur reductase-like enzyme
VDCRSEDGIDFAVKYDKLVIATGSQVLLLLVAGAGVQKYDELYRHQCGCCRPNMLAHSTYQHGGSTWKPHGAWCCIQGSTFGIPGVERHAHFLRDVKDAEQIRNELLKNWTLANVPGVLIVDPNSVIHSHGVLVAATSLEPRRHSSASEAHCAGRSRAERLRILTTVVVGGGPTGTEFAGELMHFINSDLAKIDPERARDCRCCTFIPSFQT